MTRAEIQEKVLALIHEQRTIPSGAVQPDTPLTEVGIDSLDALSVLFSIEENFNISIPDDKAKSVRTLDDIVNTIQELLPAST